MQGWISVYREILDKPIWTTSTPEQKVVLMTIMLMVNHEENEWEFKGEKYTVKSGQMITSLESIVQKCGKGISIQNVRTSLKRFEKYGFLTNESTNKNRLITIVNYGFYQAKEENLTSKVTSSQQATNKQLTTNNNDNNNNNDNKVNKDIRLEIENFRLKYDIDQLKIIDNYLEMIRHTRASGKIQESVILGMYKDWDKHPPICVMHGLTVHTNNSNLHSKKEKYTLGIIRNARADEVSKFTVKKQPDIFDFDLED